MEVTMKQIKTREEYDHYRALELQAAKERRFDDALKIAKITSNFVLNYQGKDAL
jgi:hypothetical protein